MGPRDPRARKGMPPDCNREARWGPHLRTDGDPASIHRASRPIRNHTQQAFLDVHQGDQIHGPRPGRHVFQQALVLRWAPGVGPVLLGPKDPEGSVEKSGLLEEVMTGLYYGTKESVGCVAEMVKRNLVGLGDLRFFDGYCGWEKDQLRDEIRAGYWTVAACSPSVVGLGTVGGIGLWEEVLGLMGRRKVW